MTIPTTSALSVDLDEQYRICPYAHTIHALDRESRDNRMIAQGCRRWTCAICGPRRKWQFILRVVAATPNRFITLTCRHESGPETQYARLVKQLPRLITELRKDIGSIDYLRMLETCKDGYPHFHLLVRSPFIEHAKLKEQWERFTGATIVDIRKAHGRSISYVAKYISKARDQNGEWSRQRVSVSRHFWRDTARESDLLITDHDRMHPADTAERKPRLCYSRMRVGMYSPDEREPGDQNPPELVNAYKCTLE